MVETLMSLSPTEVDSAEKGKGESNVESVAPGEAIVDKIRVSHSSERHRGAERASTYGKNVVSKEDIAHKIDTLPSGRVQFETKDGRYVTVPPEVAREIYPE
jgi:hypothetical protein